MDNIIFMFCVDMCMEDMDKFTLIKLRVDMNNENIDNLIYV